MPPHADVLQWENLPFPKSLRDFQRLFPDDDACARWLEGAKWPKGFVCPHCGEKGEPFRMATRKTVLTCRTCRKQTSLMVGTVMQRTHTPLTVWFWGAYLVSTVTPGISTVQFERQLGLTRETAFQILHKLRAGMVRQNRDRIGGNLGRGDHVEVDETYIGGAVRGQGRGPQGQTLVMAAVEVRTRPAKKGDKPMRRADAMPAGCAWKSSRRAGPSPSMPLCNRPWSRAQWSSRMHGAATTACPRSATSICRLSRGMTPTWRKNTCRSFTLSFRTSRLGCKGLTTGA